MTHTYAVRSLSWTREDGYVKVPHPVSRRIVFLPAEIARVFEMVDEGRLPDEIVESLSADDPSFGPEQLEAIVARLLELQVIEEVSQFD